MDPAITSRIYLDHAATSPLRPEAKAAMDEGFAIWANPSSPHAEGRKARAALEDARARVKAALGWEGEVIFTSGASEAAALALTRAKAGARLVGAVEHDCVLGTVPDAERLPVRSDGALDMEVLAEAVQRETPLVAVQQVNSETGNRQDLTSVADMVREAGGLLLADCAQGAGKMALPVCDMAVISAHKFGGPIGIGALLVKDYAMLEPVGGHERGYRRGTENLPGALGMAAALEACGESYSSASLDPLAAVVRDAGGVWLGDLLSDPTANIAAMAMPSMSASAQVMRLDMAGFAVSQGSACSSGTMKTSHVLKAMGLDDDLAARVIRVSIGWNTTPEDVAAFAEAWRGLA
ncbi:cysteine desulfurase family protein [Alteraurantiacibacter aquimixticola]|uniref:Cysteine desulfurase n=1 Tax=Alteraurantiacibacter aquimixticola TaxID=2489173 RepID=A0A4T3F4T4_9SPHN|nr:aminotransferase class V-fold PLP-dependent enzyme [Alteraurantiacibacter aquimixticola]TIX51801.1 aminotransferase class V-fold PLP-dependent enzyme [Alteraurantiacibacter aquimixticola]